MMDRCRPDQAGTDYTIQASIVVCTQIGMASLSGFVAEAMGYAEPLCNHDGLERLGLGGRLPLIEPSVIRTGR